MRQAYVAFLRTLSAQLTALPESAFDAELPEMDVFYLDEIASLRSNLAAAIPMWTESQRTEVRGGWEELQTGAKKAWSWDIGSLAERTEDEEGDEEEEGEYAPMVVET